MYAPMRTLSFTLDNSVRDSLFNKARYIFVIMYITSESDGQNYPSVLVDHALFFSLTISRYYKCVDFMALPHTDTN